jgi:hypothetical protein
MDIHAMPDDLDWSSAELNSRQQEAPKPPLESCDACEPPFKRGGTGGKLNGAAQ